MPAKVSAVLFDLDHTLLTDNHLEERVIVSLSSKHGPQVPHETLLAELRRFQSGAITLDEMLTTLFPGMDEMQINFLAAEFRRECLEAVPRLVEQTDNAGECIEAMEAMEIPVAVLSNGWTELQLTKAAAIRFPGPVAASEEIGLWKPAAAAFLEAARRFDFPSARTLYVGDSPETDVAGANNAGMLTAWYNPEKQAYPPGIAAPDFTVASLVELIELVGGKDF